MSRPDICPIHNRRAQDATASRRAATLGARPSRARLRHAITCHGACLGGRHEMELGHVGGCQGPWGTSCSRRIPLRARGVPPGGSMPCHMLQGKDVLMHQVELGLSRNRVQTFSGVIDGPSSCCRLDIGEAKTLLLSQSPRAMAQRWGRLLLSTVTSLQQLLCATL